MEAEVGVMHFEDERTSHKPKKMQAPLEAGKGRETDSPLDPPANMLILALQTISDF